MATKIQFIGTRADVRARAFRLKGLLTGAESDSQGVARGFQLALGFGALSDIKDAFVTKSRGGTDEMGITWPRLSPEYLAYGRRFGRGEKARLLRAAGGDPKLHKFGVAGNTGLLTKEQKARWQKIFGQQFARFYASTGSSEYAKMRAGRMAWYILKSEGALTKLAVFGNRQVEILRDTGVLFNSLSPGLLSGEGASADYQKPTSEGGDQQIFAIRPGSVTVGTNVPYAATHNYGDAKRGIPRRQFLPESDAQVPSAWWNRWLAIADRSLEVGAAILFGRAA